MGRAKPPAAPAAGSFQLLLLQSPGLLSADESRFVALQKAILLLLLLLLLLLVLLLLSLLLLLVLQPLFRQRNQSLI
jgi:hypothetical protein